MPIPTSQAEVVRDLISYALGETPGLFDHVGGNRAPILMHDAAQRIANKLAEAGMLPPDERLEDGLIRAALSYILADMPASLILDMKRAFFTRQDRLESARDVIAVRIMSELEKRGFRITKAFLTAPPSGRGKV